MQWQRVIPLANAWSATDDKRGRPLISFCHVRDTHCLKLFAFYDAERQRITNTGNDKVLDDSVVDFSAGSDVITDFDPGSDCDTDGCIGQIIDADHGCRLFQRPCIAFYSRFDYCKGIIKIVGPRDRDAQFKLADGAIVMQNFADDFAVGTTTIERSG